MDKPQPKHEIYTLVFENQNLLQITVESADIAARVEYEVEQFGEILSRQGLSTKMENTPAGFIPVVVDKSHYDITIRPTFDTLEVAKYLGRGGIVEIFAPMKDQQQFYYPEVEDE